MPGHADGVEPGEAPGASAGRLAAFELIQQEAHIGHTVNELLRIWRDNLISDEVLHHIEEELDYQESHI